MKLRWWAVLLPVGTVVAWALFFLHSGIPRRRDSLNAPFASAVQAAPPRSVPPPAPALAAVPPAPREPGPSGSLRAAANRLLSLGFPADRLFARGTAGYDRQLRRPAGANTRCNDNPALAATPLYLATPRHAADVSLIVRALASAAPRAKLAVRGGGHGYLCQPARS